MRVFVSVSVYVYVQVCAQTGVGIEAGELYLTFKAFDLQLLRAFTERLASKAIVCHV